MKTGKIACLLFLSTALALVSCARAQEEGGDNTRDQMDVSFTITPARSVKGVSGKIRMFETQEDYSHTVKLFDKLPVKFSLGTQTVDIDKTVPTTLPTHLTKAGFDAQITAPFFNFPKTYIGVGVTPSFYGDSWEFRGTDFRFQSRYFVVYRPNDQLTLLGGVALTPRYASPALPILGFIYKPNDRLNFDITTGNPQISYALDHKVSVFVESDVTADEFVVHRDNASRAILRYAKTSVGGGVKLQINKFAASSLSLGDVFNSTLEYRDNENKTGLKSGLYYEFKIEASF